MSDKVSPKSESEFPAALVVAHFQAASQAIEARVNRRESALQYFFTGLVILFSFAVSRGEPTLFAIVPCATLIFSLYYRECDAGIGSLLSWMMSEYVYGLKEIERRISSDYLFAVYGRRNIIPGIAKEEAVSDIRWVDFWKGRGIRFVAVALILTLANTASFLFAMDLEPRIVLQDHNSLWTLLTTMFHPNHGPYFWLNMVSVAGIWWSMFATFEMRETQKIEAKNRMNQA